MVLAAMMELPPPHPRIYVETIPASATGVTAMPAICHHCDPAPCIMACVPQAMHRASENGAVTNVGGKADCIACSMCVMACPFGVIARAPEPGGRLMALKCDLCPGREVPACVAACPTGALALKQGNELVPTETTLSVVAHDSIVNLPAEAIADLLRQLKPADTRSEPLPAEGFPQVAVEQLLAVLHDRRNGANGKAR
jgi:Fe-S-cluster-containing hydrogenase component 2